MEAQLNSLIDAVRQAAADGRTLRLRGGGSKDFWGQSLTGEVLSTRDYRGIVSYEPSELVVTVRCGTPLAELEAALAEKGQSLAFEPPHFGDDATVGGMVAAGLSGPSRATVGAVRDYILGARFINGLGEHLTFGGQVMKNVAGYDVSRLMAGCQGWLSLGSAPAGRSRITQSGARPRYLGITKSNHSTAPAPLAVAAVRRHQGPWLHSPRRGRLLECVAQHLGDQRQHGRRS